MELIDSAQNLELLPLNVTGRQTKSHSLIRIWSFDGDLIVKVHYYPGNLVKIDCMGKLMATPQLGKIQLLNIRDIWKHEERDFTPWLAENISHISSILNLPIVVDQIEHKVGTYELDILGHVDENDAVVVIENQFGPTDHDHLGKLIAYAAGLEASIVIWIAPEVRDEHRSTIEWLNSHADNRVSYFLLRPEVFRIDDSIPTVRFQLEAGPSEFERRLRQLVETEDAPRHEFRRRFWEDLLQYLAVNGHAWAKGRKTTKDSWISSPVGKAGINANVSMAHNSRMRVEIYLSNDGDKKLFERLHSQRDEIEAKFGDEAVNWERLEDATASRIAVYRPYDKESAIVDSNDRRELFAWITKNLAICREIARDILVNS
ncbi:MAG: DUF4268 domain-containing protein [Pirellulales bacterium]